MRMIAGAGMHTKRVKKLARFPPFLLGTGALLRLPCFFYEACYNNGRRKRTKKLLKGTDALYG